MAVQAQYPSNVLFLSRSEQEMKVVEYSQDPSGFRDPSVGFFSNGGSGNTRKRGREQMVAAPPPQHGGAINLLSLQHQAPAPTLISLAQLQNQQPPPLVSTGLRLAFEDRNQTQPNQLVSLSPPCLMSSLSADELVGQMNQHKDEIDRFLHVQAEQLRRTLSERRQRHYRVLLSAAEESAAKRLREKEAEVERAARRSAELEDRLARLRAESMAWQAKALADQAAAASLHAQLQQAAAAVAPAHGETNDPTAADDAESAHMDPGRVEPSKACRACWSRPMTVVVMPCRHLCLCEECDATAQPCPVCRSVRTGSVPVLLS